MLQGYESMIWSGCLIFSVIAAAVGAVVSFIQKKRGEYNILYLGLGVFLASFFICLPIKMYGENEPIGYAIFMSISHSIRMFVVDTAISDLTGEMAACTLSGAGFLFYKLWVCILYVLDPIFTLGVVIQYFSNIFDKLKLMLHWHDDVYLFSELNERSYTLAKKIDRENKVVKKKGLIVFCKSTEKDDTNVELEQKARRLKAVFLLKNASQVMFRRFGRRVNYYEIGEDEGNNLEETIKLMEIYTKKTKEVIQKITIYCFSTENEAETLIDAKEKMGLRVILMDEIQTAIYEQLYEHPLYENIDHQKEISVLIVGGGKVGTEFLKAAAWCGQMSSLGLRINVIDLKGNLLRKRLEQECPELLKENATGGYQFHIQKGNIFSDKIKNFLEECKEVNYCMVALGEDEENIRAGIYLRKYFKRKQIEENPTICAYIKSEQKRKAVKELSETVKGIYGAAGKVYYDIIPFGSLQNGLPSKSGTEFMVEYLGRGVNFYYQLCSENLAEVGEDVLKSVAQSESDCFYGTQYNRRSSITCGIHMKYKLWEMGLGILKREREKEAQIRSVDFREWIARLDPNANALEENEIIRKLYYLEHERWMAFMRSEGWELASDGGAEVEQVDAAFRKYYFMFKNQNPLLKLHPALVAIEDENGEELLRAVSNKIGSYNPAKNPKYIESDIKLAKNIGDIVTGKWCKGPIQIQNYDVQSDDYMIAPLEDIGRYELGQYLSLISGQKTDSAKEWTALGKEIETCYTGVIRLYEHRTDQEAALKTAEAYLAIGCVEMSRINYLTGLSYAAKAEQIEQIHGKVKNLEQLRGQIEALKCEAKKGLGLVKSE